MSSLIDVDLKKHWILRCTLAYTAAVGVAQKQNVKRLENKTVLTGCR